MTDIVAAVETAAEGAVATVEAVVEPVVTTLPATVIQTIVDVDASAAKIKAVYDKLGVTLQAWDEVVALAKAL